MDIFIDFKSPASYLAIRSIENLRLRHPNLTFNWRAFSTFEREVPSVTKDRAVAERHGEVRAASIRKIHQKYASYQGLNLKFPEEAGSADLALGALSRIEEPKEKFIEAAFKAYWIDHADLNDFSTVSNLLAKNISGTVDIDKQTLREAFDAAQAAAESAGIVQAPAFLLAGQLFIGREHMPWIEEIIQNEMAKI